MYSALVKQSSFLLFRCTVWLFVVPWPAALQASLFFIKSWCLLKIMFIELVILSNHLILCFFLLLLSSIFHSIMVFSNESALSFNWFIKTLIFKVVNDIFELTSTIFVTLFYLFPLFFTFSLSLSSASCVLLWNFIQFHCLYFLSITVILLFKLVLAVALEFATHIYNKSSFTSTPLYYSWVMWVSYNNKLTYFIPLFFCIIVIINFIYEHTLAYVYVYVWIYRNKSKHSQQQCSIITLSKLFSIKSIKNRKIKVFSFTSLISSPMLFLYLCRSVFLIL